MSRDFLSLTTLTITHLKQLIDKMPTLREDELSRLDQVISTYLFKRKQHKSSPHSEQSIQSRIRQQLISLQQKNDFLLKQIDILTRNYHREKDEIIKSNQQCKNQTQTLQSSNNYEEFIRELIQELAPFKKISTYLERLEELKKESMRKDIVAYNAQQYFERIEEIIGIELQEQEEITDFQNDYF